MFHRIPNVILSRMKYLENLHQEEKTLKHTDHFNRLRQIPPETGKLIALLAATAPPKGEFIEIGTSGGYSALWLSLACQQLQAKLKTFEINPKKIQIAQETFKITAIEKYIELISEDVFQYLTQHQALSFCFLDLEKNLYQKCYDLIIPNLISGGILLADNVISHQAELQSFIDKAIIDIRVDSILIPIGQGVLMCRKM